jgi:hypothetical protein
LAITRKWLEESEKIICSSGSIHYTTAPRRSKVPVDSFWLNNSLKITPDEQLGLVKALYFNKLPFHKGNQETVKKAMLFEDRPEYKLYYKTGWGFSENGNNIGWVVGWIEENGHPYFFVLNLESPAKEFDMDKCPDEDPQRNIDRDGVFPWEKIIGSTLAIDRYWNADFFRRNFIRLIFSSR